MTPSSSEDGGPSGAWRALPLSSLRDGCCWAAAEGLQRTRGPHHVFITRLYFLLLPCGDSSRFHFSPPQPLFHTHTHTPSTPLLLLPSTSCLPTPQPRPHPWPLVAPSMCPATGSSLTHECGRGERPRSKLGRQQKAVGFAIQTC